MVHVQGGNVTVRNFTPAAAKRVIVDAFSQEIARQQADLAQKLGAVEAR